MLQWLFQRKQNFKSKYKYEFWHKEMKKKTWWCFANKFQSRRGFKWKYRNANTDTTEWKKTWWDAGYTNQDKIIRLSNLSGKNFWLELKICIFWLKIKKTDCPNAESSCQCYWYLSLVFTNLKNQIKRWILIYKKHDEMLVISIKTRLPGWAIYQENYFLPEMFS